MAFPYQMNLGNQQPNFTGGVNNPMQGQAPNMGVPNMGVPPTPMPYSPYQPYSPYPQQSTFGMPPYNPYPQQPASSQTSYNPAYSPMGQQTTGGLGQASSTPQPTTYSVGPMGLPVTIDQSLMGGAPKPGVPQTPVAPTTGVNPQSRYAQYNFDPVTQEYLDRMEKKSAMVPDMGTWRYDPATQSFTQRGAYMPLGVPEPTISLAEMQQRAKADAASRAGSPDQSPFAVNTTATPTSKPSTPNIAPKPTLTPQQIAQRNMMQLQQSLLEAGSRGPAGLQGFLDQLPKTGLTPQQVRAQQQAQMQLRNQQRLRNPSLASDPFTYTPRPATPVRPAPTLQVNQVTRRMNPDGTFSIA